MRLKSQFESLRKRGRFSEPISFAAELHIISTLRLERLYESCNVLLDWGRSPFQGWAPGRAAKIRFARRWRYFSGNFGHFSASWPNLFCKRDFSKTHSWTCHLHSPKMSIFMPSFCTTWYSSTRKENEKFRPNSTDSSGPKPSCVTPKKRYGRMWTHWRLKSRCMIKEQSLEIRQSSSWKLKSSC